MFKFGIHVDWKMVTAISNIVFDMVIAISNGILVTIAFKEYRRYKIKNKNNIRILYENLKLILDENSKKNKDWIHEENIKIWSEIKNDLACDFELYELINSICKVFYNPITGKKYSLDDALKISGKTEKNSIEVRIKKIIKRLEEKYKF